MHQKFCVCDQESDKCQCALDCSCFGYCTFNGEDQEVYGTVQVAGVPLQLYLKSQTHLGQYYVLPCCSTICTPIRIDGVSVLFL